MEDRAVLRDFEQGRGRRIVVVILAVLALAIVIGAVVAGFRGRSPQLDTGRRPSAAKRSPAPIVPAIPSRM